MLKTFSLVIGFTFIFGACKTTSSDLSSGAGTLTRCNEMAKKRPVRELYEQGKIFKEISETSPNLKLTSDLTFKELLACTAIGCNNPQVKIAGIATFDKNGNLVALGNDSAAKVAEGTARAARAVGLANIGNLDGLIKAMETGRAKFLENLPKGNVTNLKQQLAARARTAHAMGVVLLAGGKVAEASAAFSWGAANITELKALDAKASSEIAKESVEMIRETNRGNNQASMDRRGLDSQKTEQARGILANTLSSIEAAIPGLGAKELIAGLVPPTEAKVILAANRLMNDGKMAAYERTLSRIGTVISEIRGSNGNPATMARLTGNLTKELVRKGVPEARATEIARGLGQRGRLLVSMPRGPAAIK